MIKIDMMDVQLGSAILLQFSEPNENAVTILADAGVSQGGKEYSEENFLEKLKAYLSPVGDKFHIHLLIGTHYDHDHLNRMRAIIEDDSIIIHEAWMPPVTNDTNLRSVESTFDDIELLALQFANSFENRQSFLAYLKAKKRECDFFSKVEILCREAKHAISVEGELYSKNFLRRAREKFWVTPDYEPDSTSLDEKTLVEYFKTQIENDTTENASDQDFCHSQFDPVDDQIFDRIKNLGNDDFWGVDLLSFYFSRFFDEMSFAHDLYPLSPSSDLRMMNILSNERSAERVRELRKSTAKDAINANALNEVIVALKQKSVPIACRYINDGEPRQFCWDSARNKFAPSKQSHSSKIKFSLLGPSIGLIKKYRHRLPVQKATSIAMFHGDIPIRSITPSNQLSYVLHFRAEGQGILICGDTGCNDFKPAGRSAKYYDQLLETLYPLNVVQIAHHGGHNAHFYRVLLEADQMHQTDSLKKAHLLLSHEHHSKFRPSVQFALFVEQLRCDTTGPNILFTNRPLPHKVVDFSDLIAPVGGQSAKGGDVSLEFSNGDWDVISHPAGIPQPV